MENPKLALIPSGYKSGTVYSILPTDGVGDFDLSRGSTATRVNKDGLIETVNNNVPKLDWLNSDCPSLLLEPQRTNVMLFSEEFSGTNWSSVRTSLTSNTIISPDGQITADKLQRTSTSGAYRTHNISKSGAITYTTSAFIKKGSDDYFSMRAQGSYPSRVDIRFRFDTEQIYYAQSVSNFTLIDSDVQSYSNGWYRIFFTYTTDTHSNLAVSFSPRASNGNIDSGDISSDSFAYVWGAQTEEGSYPTSYIKTTSSTVTRLKDVCINGGDSDLFNSVEGVIYAEFKNHTELGSFRQINLRLNSTNRIYISKRSDNARLEFRMENPLGQKSYSFIQNTSDDFVKIAFRYAPNNFGVFINGVNKNISSSGNTFASGTLSTLEFASPISNQNFYGKVKDLRVYNKALTNDELIQLTTI